MVHSNTLRIILIAMGILLFSCASKKTFIAKAPDEVGEKFIFHPDISEVSIPIELSIPGMEAAINKQLNGLLYEENGLQANDNVVLDLKVWKQSDIKLDVQGDDVLYTVPLKIWTNTLFKAEILGIAMEDSKEADCAVELQFKSKVYVDSLWKVQTKTSLLNYTWIKKPVIKVGSFELPVSWIADKVLKSQKEDLVKSLDEQVHHGLDIKPFLVEAWNKLQTPILVNDSPQVWLSIKPIRAFMVPFKGKLGKLTSSIGISAYVESVVGKEPNIPKTALPNLKFVPKGPEQFSISLINDISYEKATQLCIGNMVGQSFEFKEGKYKVTISDMELYPSGEKLTIKTSLTGSLNGTVYLKGMPVFDSTSKELRLVQIEYDLDTRNKLQKTASWLLHGTIERKIEQYFHYPLKERIKQSEELIRQSLQNNRIAPHIVLNGTLLHLAPKDIVLTPSGIRTIVNAKGLLQMQIDGF